MDGKEIFRKAVRSWSSRREGHGRCRPRGRRIACRAPPGQPAHHQRPASGWAFRGESGDRHRPLWQHLVGLDPLALVDAIDNGRVSRATPCASGFRRRHDLGERRAPLGRMSGDRSEPVLVVLAAGAPAASAAQAACTGRAGRRAVLDLLASDRWPRASLVVLVLAGSATGSGRPLPRGTNLAHADPRSIFASSWRRSRTVDGRAAASRTSKDARHRSWRTPMTLMGGAALSLLAQRLPQPSGDNALVGLPAATPYRRQAVPRGVCALNDHGTLVSIEERPQRGGLGPGPSPQATGLQPAALDATCSCR